MFKAGFEADFNDCDFKLQYPSPEKQNDPVMRKYLDTCKYTDYLMKFKNIKH